MDSSEMANKSKSTSEKETGSQGSGEEEARSATQGGQNSEEASESPLRLTRLAAEKVLEIMESEDLVGSRLRVKVKGGGCAGFEYELQFDEGIATSEDGLETKFSIKATDPVGPTDVKVESHGVTLVVDQMSLMYLNGTEIDYVESLQGTGFRFNNPMTSSTCGCGQSFSV